MSMDEDKHYLQNPNQLEELVEKWKTEQIQRAVLVQTTNESLAADLANHTIQFIGGLDISYSTKDPSIACGCCVVYDQRSKSIVYSDLIEQQITIPYIPGYLAYREMTVYRVLLDKLRSTPFWPSVFLVDGQGMYHPRHFGSACEIGLAYDCVTIGVAKNPFCGDCFVIAGKQSECKPGRIDVCSEFSQWKRHIPSKLAKNRIIPIDHYGEVIGALYCSPNHSKPIYISIGNKLTLEQAIQIVIPLCNFRIPEPIRMADHLSREFIRKRISFVF